MMNPISSENLDLVLRAIQQSSKPVNLANLKKAIPKSSGVTGQNLKELLISLVESGQIQVHRAKSTVYWTRSLEEQASGRILEALNEMPLTKTELKNKFKTLLYGWPEKKREDLLSWLVKEKRVFKVKGLPGIPEVFSTRSPLILEDYVKLAINLALTKLAKKKIDRDQFFAVALDLFQPSTNEHKAPMAIIDSPALPETNVEQLVLDGMTQLSPAAANGALVSLTELRNLLRNELPEKNRFDQMVLRLAETGRFALHQHDYPGSLTEEERDALVIDSRNNYYIGIALRK